MGVRKVNYYTVICNNCHSPLEDWTGELAKITDHRKIAEQMALDHGFKQTGINTWVCPNCQIMERKEDSSFDGSESI